MGLWRDEARYLAEIISWQRPEDLELQPKDDCRLVVLYGSLRGPLNLVSKLHYLQVGTSRSRMAKAGGAPGLAVNDEACLFADVLA